MSMSFHSAVITVCSRTGEKILFAYEYDNEICPEIRIPFNWKARCKSVSDVLALIDAAFVDPFDEDEMGLLETIKGFDCPPYVEFEKEYKKFIAKVKKKIKGVEDLKEITLIVTNDGYDSGIEDKKVLSF